MESEQRCINVGLTLGRRRRRWECYLSADTDIETQS